MTTTTDATHQAGCGILEPGPRASSILLAAEHQAAASKGTCVLSGTSGGCFGHVAAFVEGSRIQLMGGRRRHCSLRSGAGGMHRITRAAGWSCGSPETLCAISACVGQEAVDTRPPAAAPTATCLCAASRPPGSAIAAQRRHLPLEPPPPYRAWPTAWMQLNNFITNWELSRT